MSTEAGLSSHPRADAQGGGSFDLAPRSLSLDPRDCLTKGINKGLKICVGIGLCVFQMIPSGRVVSLLAPSRGVVVECSHSHRSFNAEAARAVFSRANACLVSIRVFFWVHKWAQCFFGQDGTFFAPTLHLFLTSAFPILQKWSKGKVREKLNNMVCFDQNTYDRMMKEVATFKLVTPSAISERLKVPKLSTSSAFVVYPDHRNHLNSCYSS